MTHAVKTEAMQRLAPNLKQLSQQLENCLVERNLRGMQLLQPHLRPGYVLRAARLFNLPAGNDVPFKPTMKEHDLQNVLKANFRMLKNYLTGENPDWPKFKRETSFIGFLESLDPDDAKLVIGMKDKVCIYKNITKDLVKKAFPDETKDW